MKCEKCSNEAVLHYQSNINGEKTEYHLCADCAKKEGFGEILEIRPHPMYGSLFREPFGALTESFFRDPIFSLADSFFGGGLFAPVLPVPEVRVAVGEAEKPAESEAKHTDNIPEDAGREIRSRREIHALKHQLRAAVIDEEFEKAAELRDKIRELEK
jgi:protein arginine kinase activator